MKKTKIVATIGPASWDEATLRELFAAGVNVCRLNFSHGDYKSHKQTMDRIKKVREEMNLPIALMLDTKGPEIRTVTFKGGEATLQEGASFALYAEEREGDEAGVAVTYGELYKDVAPGQMILMDDGLLALEVEAIEGTTIHTKVLNGGLIKDHKGINVPGASIQLPALTEKDVADIRFGIEEGVDFIAASFIRKKDDLLAIRDVLESYGGEGVKVIAKIENKEGIENMDAIASFADGIMVARGDMGVEIETERVPLVQKQLIERAIDEGIPVITATQMLDSMMRNPRPTRAEVGDVANAIIDGTSAVMLSGETAGGKYPLEAVKTMAKVCAVTEAALDYEHILNKSAKFKRNTTNVIVRHAVEMAEELSADAIVIATSTGFSSRNLAKFRPEMDTFAVTDDDRVLRQMSLQWGVTGVKGKTRGREIFEHTAKVVKRAGYIKDGDLIVMVAGIPQGVAGSTNVVKVHQVASTLHKGMGIVGGHKTARVRIVTDDGAFMRDFTDGDIIVAKSYDKSLAPYLARCGGFISEEEGLTSPSAIAGLSVSKPTIVGCAGITGGLMQGDVITMNADTGEIFLGNVRTK